jgi:hypothetical protein
MGVRGQSVNLGEIQDQSQRRLIEFLKVDLELGFTFTRMAQTRDNGYKRLLQNARKVLESVRRLEGRIVDRTARKEIHERADELKRLLADLDESL